jgi:uncharacterized protein (DUF2235 family)
MAVQKIGTSYLSSLILLLDGTWQTDAGDQPPTNIVRLRDLILPKAKANGKEIAQHVYYDSGVGTGGSVSKRSFDGATGNGLEDIVRGAYRQICYRYEPKAWRFMCSGFRVGLSVPAVLWVTSMRRGC